MHPVGDVADRHGVLRFFRIERPPHGARNFAMQRGDRIGSTGEFESEHGHAERFLKVVGADAPETHEVIVRKAELIAHRPEVFLDKDGIEAVVARGNRWVRGEYDFARNLARRRHEVHTFFLHTATNGFENGEAAVTLVEVQNAGRDAHGPEGAKSADAEQQFLANARATIAAIEARGELAIFGRVAFDVGVEQEQITTAHLDAPDLGANGAAAGLNLDNDRLAIRTNRRLHRALIHVGLEIFFFLPSAAVKTLQEIALAIKEPHP